MAGEEARGIFARELWDACMTTHVGVERLLGRSESVEEIESHPSIVPIVIPLEENMQWDPDTTRLFHSRARYVAAGEEAGRRDT